MVQSWPKGPPEDELDLEHAYEKMIHVHTGNSSDHSDDSDVHFGSTDDDDDDSGEGSDRDAGDLLSQLPPHMLLQILRQFTHPRHQTRQSRRHEDDDNDNDDDDDDDEDGHDDGDE